MRLLCPILDSSDQNETAVPHDSDSNVFCKAQMSVLSSFFIFTFFALICPSKTGLRRDWDGTGTVLGWDWDGTGTDTGLGLRQD